MKTIFGLFNNYDDARTAVEKLLSKNLDKEEINVIVQQRPAKDDIKARAEQEGKKAKQGEMKSGSATLDKLLSKEQPVNFTGIGGGGSLYAAGSLATMLAQTASMPGKNSGGLQNALADFGVADDAAEAYSDGIMSGGLLLWVRTPDERASEVADIMRSQKGKHVANYAR